MREVSWGFLLRLVVTKFLLKNDVFKGTVLVNTDILYSYFKNSKYLEVLPFRFSVPKTHNAI